MSEELTVDVKVAIKASTWRALDKFARENHFESVGSLLAVMGERVYRKAQSRCSEESQIEEPIAPPVRVPPMIVTPEEDARRVAAIRRRNNTGNGRSAEAQERKRKTMERIRELNARGMNDSEIGRELGYTSSLIRMRRVEMGLESNYKKKAAA